MSILTSRGFAEVKILKKKWYWLYFFNLSECFHEILYPH